MNKYFQIFFSQLIFVLFSCSSSNSTVKTSKRNDTKHTSDGHQSYRSAAYLTCSKYSLTEDSKRKIQLMCHFEFGEEQIHHSESLFLVAEDIIVTKGEGEGEEILSFEYLEMPDEKFVITLDENLVEAASIGILELSGYPQSKGKSRTVFDIVAFGSEKVSRSGCYISQNICSKDRAKTGTFLEEEESITDAMSCLARANIIHRWCDNPATELTKAEYFIDGTLVDQADHKTPLSGCYIEQSECTKDPKYGSIFRDSREETHNKLEACLYRALDYSQWCENPSTVITTAKFYKDKQLVEEHPHNAPLSGCYIEQTQCKSDPSYIGLFKDGDEETATDQILCLKKASDHHNFCDNPADVMTTAKFYVGKSLKAEANQNTPINGCYIEQKECKNFPEFVGIFKDRNVETNNSQALCMERANQYHVMCDNLITEISTARFYSDLVLLEEANHNTPLNGCYITQDTCIRRADYVGTFKDINKEASQDKNICLERANQFKTWCGNPEDAVTTAEFYINKELQK